MARIPEPRIIGSLDEGLVAGKSEHEVFVFRNGQPVKGFRTDVTDCFPFVREEAERYRQRLQSENPGDSYTTGTIQLGYGIYDGVTLFQHFIASDARLFPSMKSEAEGYATMLRRQDPSKDYIVKEI